MKFIITICGLWFMGIIMLPFSSQAQDNNVFRFQAEMNGFTDEMVIGFYDNAEAGFDPYDSEKMFAGSEDYPQIYTIVDGHNLAINGYPPFTSHKRIVQGGFRVYKADTVRFTATNIADFYADVDVYFYDTAVDSLVDLRKQNTYSIVTSGTIETDTRFEFYFIDRQAHAVRLTESGSWPDSLRGYDRVTLAENATINLPAARQEARCKTLTLEPGASLYAQGNLVVMDSLIIRSPEDSTLSASLIDAGELMVYGSRVTERFVPQNRWFYIRPPVSHSAGADFGCHHPENYLYHWQETAENHGWNAISNTGELPLEKGFAYYRNNTGDTTLAFTGATYTGPVGSGNNLTHTDGTYKAGFNLTGNPYPSYLDMGTNAESSGITFSNLHPTIWYRHQGDFLTYNRESGDAESGASRYAAPMQAFWVYVDSGSYATFKTDNAARTTADTANQVFLKKSGEDSHLLRLSISQGNFIDETLIGFYPEASEDFEAFDSPKLFATDHRYPQLFTTVSDYKFAIQGLAQKNQKQTVTAGLKTGTAGTFTLKAKNITRFNAAERVFLVDSLTGRTVNLRKNPTYQFTLEQPVMQPARFRLVFMPAVSSGIMTNQQQQPLIFTANKRIGIRKSGNGQAQVRIFHITGQLLARETARWSGTKFFRLPGKSGVFVVRVKTPGFTATKKVVLP